MRIQRTSQVITFAIVVVSVAAIVCALWARSLRIVQERAYEDRRKMFNFTDQLATGSDRLTAAVRAFAATGEPRYREAFQRELTADRNRDAAADGLRQLGITAAELLLINNAKRNSDELVHLEQRALAEAGSNDLDRAIQTVYGPQYEKAKAAIMAPIVECRRGMEQRLTARAVVLSARARALTNIALAVLILNAGAMIAALLLFYRRHVVNPLADLNQSLRELTARKRGVRIGFQEEDSEIGEVARSMENYRAKVEELLEAVRQAKAREAEATAQELRLAREIQMGMLPHDFASVGQAYHLDFGAVLEPAREVGGDLYGVCAAGPERLVVFLGDVSGKGLAASMFMVRAISLARVLAREISEPEAILARLNDELAVDNPSGMFVTFLCAVIEPGRQRLTIANAGHCRPILLSDHESPRWAVKRLGTALGFDAGLSFERTELTLHDGDSLIFYSDGVSEAFNPRAECYGNERLLAEAGRLSGRSAAGMTAALLDKVRAFAGTAPQSDDIAILALKVNSAWAPHEGKALAE
jgi:sigma-B regulation protein RsbU (phosphoserine phosphatase)